MTHRLPPLLLALAGTASTALLAGSLAGCKAHGAFTSAGRDQAQQSQERMKAASRYDLAMQEFKSGDPKRALQTIDQSIAANAGTPSAHVLRGRILTELGRVEEAPAAFDRALAIEPDNPETLYFRAMALERTGKRAEALRDYRKALELSPSGQQYAMAAAELLIEDGKLDDAAAMLNHSSPEVRGSAGVLQTLGHIDMMRGDAPAGLAHFRDASTLSPADPVLLDDLARAQVANGKIAEAEATLSRLLAMPKMDKRRDLVLLRARCLQEMDRPVEARALLLKLVDAGDDDADPVVWQRLFDIGRQLGDVALQRRAAAKMIAIAPDQPDGHLAMGLCQRDMGEIDLAIISLERAVARSTHDATAAKTLGLLEAQLGNQKAAASAFKRTTEIDPSDARARKLAEMYASGEVPANP